MIQWIRTSRLSIKNSLSMIRIFFGGGGVAHPSAGRRWMERVVTGYAEGESRCSITDPCSGGSVSHWSAGQRWIERMTMKNTARNTRQPRTLWMGYTSGLGTIPAFGGGALASRWIERVVTGNADGESRCSITDPCLWFRAWDHRTLVYRGTWLIRNSPPP